jgi:organic hydroperoxide reductase OsmC/OhrA
MHTFETALTWKGGKSGHLNARQSPTVAVATPPAFGGPEGQWSPEELLVGAVQSCLMSTFIYFAERLKLNLDSYSSTANGVMEQTQAGLRFTGIDVNINSVVSDEQSLKKILSANLKEKLEKYCPISAAINCPVSIDLNISM